MKILPILAIIIGIVAILPSGQSATATSVFSNPGAGSIADCAPTKEIIAVVGVLTAGQVDSCVYYERTAPQIDSGVTITFITAGPGVIGANTLTYGATFVGLNGCTASAWSTTTDSTAAGTGGTGSATITMTSHHCRGYLELTITSSNPALSTFIKNRFALGIVVPYDYELTYLCAATGSTPDVFDAATNVCNAPLLNVAQSGTWTLSGIPDTQQEIQAIADALAAGLEVEICPEVAPCYHVVSGNLNSTVNINGTVNIDANTTETTTLEPSLYWFIIGFAMLLIWIGESRGLYGPRAFGAILLLVVGFVAIWEQSKLGFDDVPGLLIPMLGFTMLLGGYFLVKPLWEEKQ